MHHCTMYDIYQCTDNYLCLIKGNSQEGNHAILLSAGDILSRELDISIARDELIWMHGDGPSPHFILYHYNDSLRRNLISPLQIELFVKSLCPSKSNKNRPLHSSLLSRVQLSMHPGVKGQVQVKSVKLSKLLLCR